MKAIAKSRRAETRMVIVSSDTVASRGIGQGEDLLGKRRIEPPSYAHPTRRAGWRGTPPPALALHGELVVEAHGAGREGRGDRREGGGGDGDANHGRVFGRAHGGEGSRGEDVFHPRCPRFSARARIKRDDQVQILNLIWISPRGCCTALGESAAVAASTARMEQTRNEHGREVRTRLRLLSPADRAGVEEGAHPARRCAPGR